MPRVNKKTQVNAANNVLQASRRPAKGFKHPPKDLSEWIRLANLIPQGQRVLDPQEILASGAGSWPLVLENIAKLPDPLRSELLNYSQLPENWETDRRGNIVLLGTNSQPADVERMSRTYDHYIRIHIAAKFIRLLARPLEDERTLGWLESFVTSLRYAELSYLRECKHQGCGAIFYAKRKTQLGCTPAHGSAIRKKAKRDRDRAARQAKQELAEGKKRAKKRAAKRATADRP